MEGAPIQTGLTKENEASQEIDKSDKIFEDGQGDGHWQDQNINRYEDSVENCYKSGNSPCEKSGSTGEEKVAEISANMDVAHPNHNSTTRERLHELTQEIVREVNDKRHKDSQLLNDYKKDQITQVESFCSRIENHLFEVYKVQNKEMQDRIQRILETLDRISKLETELQEFRNVLNNLYKEIMSS